MTVIDWPKGQMIFYNNIRKHIDTILNGVVLAVDPSSGSANSMPGFAVYSQGELLLSGTVKINAKANVYNRLQELYLKITELLACPPDLLLIEQVNKQMSHQYLQFAIGVTIAAAKAPDTIEVPICIWKSVAKKEVGYAKSDSFDAVMIGKAAVLLAKREHNKNVNTEPLPEKS